MNNTYYTTVKRIVSNFLKNKGGGLEKKNQKKKDAKAKKIKKSKIKNLNECTNYYIQCIIVTLT